MQDVEERMQALGSSDVCALFLLSVESREAGKVIDLENGAERAASLLSRFFRITDIVGYLGENRFAAFLTGHLTSSVVWEKAATLSEALWFATEQTPAETIESYVGVYVFRAYDDEFKAIFRKAEYALEMAHKDANRRFYIYTMPGTEQAFFRAAPESFSSQMLRSYIDEGVRLIEVGTRQSVVYISPGYYRRLALTGDAAAPRQIRIHPADRDDYERDVAAAAETGRPVESRYRVSRDGAAWIPCRLRLLRIAEAEGRAVVLEISHNISGLEELKNQYAISKSIRRMIIFAPHNMLSDPPFGKLDLISCRNVMIYFQPVLQRSLFAIFHSALKNGGYLFLGKSETANEYSDVFKPACSAEKIYIHNGTGKTDNLAAPTFNIPNIQPMQPRAVSLQSMESQDYGMETLYTRFLEKFMPASLVLNSANSVIHFFGNYMDYVAIAPGKASFNLFSIINKELSLAASTALSRCRAENSPVTYTDIPVETASGYKHVDLSVYPIRNAGKDDSGLTAMIFADSRAPEPVAPEGEAGVREKYDIDTTAARRITDLEQELQESQDDLRKTIGELETVNEELQAANEELYTVNTEYQQKVDELTMTTNDLSNFLSSTMIGILFVDGNLNIRKFTEYIGREFQFMEQDVGRSIQIFAHSFPYEKIVEDAQTVLKTLTPIDREVVATNGQYYTLRIAPYRTTENSIKGLVITIIDSLETGRARKTQD